MRPSSAGPPYDPDEALRHFRLDPGFRIELAVSEPDIQSPVAMEIDERGRWFVAEMPGYPLDPSPTGRIKLLEDTNHDGRPDRSRVFADRLVLPSGVMRWRRGVIVTSVPDVLYLEDADDDGVAERREVLVTGFARTNPQHMVNTPLYGLDNWIYLAHEGAAGAVIYTDRFGDTGRPLTMPGFPNQPPVDAGRQSVRFRPESGEIEIMSGQSQYGHAFDEWGRYFGSNNSNHIRLEVLAARYLARNRDLPFSTAMADISDHGSAAQVFPITERPTYELLTEAGEFTSACSLTPYTGGAFPGDYAHSTFVAEPVHNLVHRDVLTPDGASLRARRGSEGREFLASTDAWFRPVSFYVGPDGALYIIDYYRKRIEHPEWTASEFHRNPAEFTLGSDRGRIYRVISDGTPAAPPLDSLAEASDETLVKALASPNLWWRRTAQRLLVDRKSERGNPGAGRACGRRRLIAWSGARAVDARRSRTARRIDDLARADRFRVGRSRKRAAPRRTATRPIERAVEGRCRAGRPRAGRARPVPGARHARLHRLGPIRRRAVPVAPVAHRRCVDAACGAQRRYGPRVDLPPSRAGSVFRRHVTRDVRATDFLPRSWRRDRRPASGHGHRQRCRCGDGSATRRRGLVAGAATCGSGRTSGGS